jgi:formimidoylglutamate deiminase
VTRRWTEELRLLEYAQRLTRRRRNVAAQAGGRASSAAALFEGALAGGQSASGRPLGAIAVGHRADFLVLDAQSSALLGIPPENLLDALVFSSPDARFSEVRVGGASCVTAGGSGAPDSSEWHGIRQGFVGAMQALWS